MQAAQGDAQGGSLSSCHTGPASAGFFIMCFTVGGVATPATAPAKDRPSGL